MRTKILNINLIIGVDKDEQINIIKDAQIHIDGNIIEYAGSANNAPEFSCDRKIDGEGNIAMPGMVNLHTHNPMTLLRGVGGNYGLEDWLNKAIFPREKKLSNEAVASGSRLGILEMLRFGTTSYCDMYMFMDAQAKVVDEIGMRACLAHGMVDFDNSCKDFEVGLKFAEDWNNKANGRITTSLAPHSTYLTTEKLLHLTAEHSAKLDIPVHVHISETQTEVKTVIERFGMTPSQLLYKTGILERPVIAAHCVWLTDDDFKLLAGKNFTVAHNPISNLKLASGIADTARMLDEGIAVALGTDGVASNNNLNLWEEMRAFPLLQKAKHLNPLLIGPAQALKAATLNGAKAMGYDNLGLIKEGYIADIILVDTHTAVSCPANDVESDIIYSIQGSDVIMTMVDGNVLYYKGEYRNIDKDRVFAEAKMAAESLNI